MIKKYSLVLIALLCTFFGFGQTLSAGDIAFLQYNADGSGTTIKFLALTDIPSGEVIYFTDNGWQNSNSFRSGEGIVTWTSTGVSCGDVVSFGEGGMALSVDGDQILAYQGSVATPTFISAIHMNGAWDANATNTNTSAIPIGLTNSLDCLSIDPEVDNAKYNGILTGTISDIRTAINDSSNWITSPSAAQNFANNFTLSDCSNSCTPTHTVTGFNPTSGPTNTEVTIIGSGFVNPIVSFNGSSATIVSGTSTEIVVNVPNGVSTGAITVTESACDVKSSLNFTVIDNVNTGCEGSVNTSELFISEVTDATSGSLSYIEIYNSTGASVNLSDYTLEIRYNASGTENSINLSGTLVNQGIHVVSTTIDTPCSVSGGNASLADQTTTMSGINTAKNSSDCVSLYKNYVDDANPGTLIDVWGDCNDKNWRENLGVGIGDEGFDFRRLAASNPPSTTFNIADWNIIDWTDGTGTSTCSENDYSDVGHYTPGLPPSITTQPSVPSVCNPTISLTTTATEGLVGNHPLTYQWYYVAPGDSNWNSVNNDATFSGATNNELIISNPLNVLDYQFYCQVREDEADCFKATKATKVDLVKTTWNGSSWNNGIPDNTIIAVIDGNYNTSSGSFSACQLLVKSGATLTVSNSRYVQIVNNVIVKGQLNVETKGAFVQDNDSSTYTLNSGGGSQVNKFTVPLSNWYDYTYWSSPVIDANVGTTFSTSDRRFYYDSASYLDADGDGIDDNADNWKVATTGSMMTPGIGYIATHTNIGFFPGASYQYNFIGAFNNGVISPPLAYNSINPRHWNLIGNPYPCAIDINNFFTENADTGLIEEIVYLWSHHSPPSADNIGNDILNFSISDYAIINGSGPLAGASGDTPGMYIPSGQSFFVNSLQTGNATFNNAMRLAGNNSNDLFFRNNNQKESNSFQRLWVNLTTDNGVFNQILISYHNKATEGYDGLAYDAEPVYTGYANLYTTIEGEDRQLAIQGKATESLTEDETIALGFNAWIDAKVHTIYTISIPNREGDFFTNNTVFLKDHLLNVVHELSESDYEFTSEYGMFPNRFEIVFKDENRLSINDEALINTLKIIEQDNGEVQFLLDSSLELKHITIIDVLGRTLYSFETTGNSRIFNLDNINTGTYIAKVTLSDDTIVTKKAMKKL